MDKEKVDELLELCVVLEERQKLDKVSKFDLEHEFKVHQPHLIDTNRGLNPLEIVNWAVKEGVLKEDGEKISLTALGKTRAEGIVRRHRLAEKLFTDVMELPYSQSEPAACMFEHILTEEVTDSVCSFLGHPPMCPHDKAIPRGACCKKFTKEVAPIVMSLTEFSPGEGGKIVFISSLHPQRLQKLSSLGIMPGNKIALIQKNPSFVIRIAETQIALDSEIVSEIYVRKEAK